MSARTLIAALVAAPWVVWAIVVGVGIELPYPVAPALAFTPYVALTAIVPVVLALLLRQWPVALLATVSLGVLALIVVPRGVGDPEVVSGGDPITVMSVNVLQGRASPEAVMNLVRDHDVEVLSVQEARPQWIERFDALGGGSTFPARSVRAFDEALFGPRGMRAAGEAAGDVPLSGGGSVRVHAIHPQPPTNRTWWRAWHDELTSLPPAGPEPYVLAGDFNATLDHPELRDLINDGGYRDAAAVVGKGLATTWPAGRRFPPEITIDHVLVGRRIAVRQFTVHGVPGSDHRAVIAELIVQP